MNSNQMVQQPQESFVGIDSTIPDCVVAYDYHLAVCDSLSVAAMPAVRFGVLWARRRNEAAKEAEQKAPTNGQEVKVTTQCHQGDWVVTIEAVGSPRTLGLRTKTGTADEIREQAEDVRKGIERRQRMIQFMLAGADELDRIAQTKAA